jgi:regulator of cell morphogenesis and NO signaling
MSASSASSSLDWSRLPLTALLDAILDQHHAQLTRSLRGLNRRLGGVAAAYGLEYYQLQEVARVFLELQLAVERYMASEARSLFPCLRRSQQTAASPAADRPPDKVGAAVEEARQQQSRVVALFEQLRDSTDGYHVPEDACPSYQAAMRELSELDRYLSDLYDKESRILFARVRWKDGEVVQD